MAIPPFKHASQLEISAIVLLAMYTLQNDLKRKVGALKQKR